MKRWNLIIFIVVAEAVGLLGSLFTAGNISAWYSTLHKPAFSPPNWLFGPVWLTLYALMGLAAYLIWKKGRSNRTALTFYWLQLAVNGIWMPMFFGLHQIGLALAVILILLVLIVATIIFFRPLSKKAAWLLAPYLVWVSFASVLNFFLWRLN